MFEFGRDLTDRERRLIYNYQLEIYDQFKLAVAEGRSIPIEDIEPLAQGKIFTGLQTKELNLVDEIGSITRAIEAAKEGAGIKGKAKIVRVIKIEDGWLTIRSRVSTMLGLDQLNFKNYIKRDLAEFNSYIY